MTRRGLKLTLELTTRGVRSRSMCHDPIVSKLTMGFSFHLRNICDFSCSKNPKCVNRSQRISVMLVLRLNVKVTATVNIGSGLTLRLH